MESIRVAIRVRGSEDYHIDSSNSISCVSCRGNLIDIKSPDIRNKSNSFLFDAVYDDSKTQDEVFSDVKTLIDDSLNGFNVTIFAYGMTGSGDRINRLMFMFFIFI